MRNTSRLTLSFASSLVLVAPLALGACGGGQSPAGQGGQESASKARLPAALALPGEPAGARSVKEVVAQAKSGDEVVVAGRVGVEGSDRAYFTLVDSSLQACSETAMNDPCETPWDFCCSPPDELSKLSALIEFRDGAGLYSGNVLGFAGLEHLKGVVVKGKADKDASGNLTVVASGIFVK
jgi:hypothetical protein